MDKPVNLLLLRDLIKSFDDHKMKFSEEDVERINKIIQRAVDRKEARDKLYNYPPK